jgi:hypothetical protein
MKIILKSYNNMDNAPKKNIKIILKILKYFK